jgi:Domain of unknown function (DUF5134)
MTGPSSVADALAASMILTAGYCVTRLALSWRYNRATDHQVDLVHVLMGVAMAGMLVPKLRVFWAGGWEVVFGIAVLIFAWRMIGDARMRTRPGHPSGHHAQHLLGCVAMVYMLAAVTSAARAGAGSAAPGVMSGSTAHVRTLALILAVCLLGYVVWAADRMPSLARVAALSATGTPAMTLASSGSGQVSTSAEVPAGQRAGIPLSPRLAACCEIAMGITMGYMLVVML